MIRCLQYRLNEYFHSFLVIYCGPTEWRFERRRGSSIDRKNTVRHLIQMMAISEEGAGSPRSTPMREEDEEEEEEENGDEKPPAMSQSLPVAPSQPFSKYTYIYDQITN